MALDDDHKCPFCGAEISAEDKKCKKCGKKLRRVSGNGARKGLGRALSEKYRERIKEAQRRKKEEIVTPEAREVAIGLFSIIPNIGKARAEAFWNAGFRTIEDLRKASVEEISQVEGIGRKLAEQIHKSIPSPEIMVEKGELLICRSCGAMLSSKATECGLCGVKIGKGEVSEEEKIMKELEEVEVYLCTECGSFIAKGSEKCEICGAVLGEEEEEVGEEKVPLEAKEEKEEIEELYLCSKCGVFVGPEAKTCFNCGQKIELPEEEPELETPRLFICPECGSFLSTGAKECRYCGAVFAPEVEAEIPEEEELEKAVEPGYEEERPELFICPECGSFLSEGAKECGFCGAVFAIEEEAEIAEEEEFEKIPEPEYEEEMHELFMCPECGSFFSKGAEKCPSCGVRFAPIMEAEIAEEREPEKVTRRTMRRRSPRYSTYALIAVHLSGRTQRIAVFVDRV